MLLRQSELEGIMLGQIQLVFRCWQRPTVKTGGSLLTPVGKLNIVAVDDVERDSIAEDEARRAGYGSLTQLRAELDRYPRSRVFRVTLGPLEPDPRIALRNQSADAAEASALAAKLAGLDRRAPTPWTAATLAIIERRPETRAAALARELGHEREPFKLNVRKLKNLGLTESLDVGYRLSPRGESVLAWLRETADPQGSA
jgi:hypothetical protein